MIGDFPTGAMQGIVISAVAHEGLSVHIDGEPGRLAIVDKHGNIVSTSDFVAREVEAVSVNSYRKLLQGKGHLRVLSNPMEAKHG